MKAIVNGLLYDTNSAELVYNDTNNKRKYYRTANGNFFTFYNNGEIIPRPEQAMKDLLGKVDIDKYMELFGKPEEA